MLLQSWGESRSPEGGRRSMTSSAILTTICAHFRVFGIRDNSTAAIRCISSPLCARKSGVCPTIAGLMNPVGVVEDPPLVQAHHRGDALPAADGETPSAPPAPLLRKPVEWHSQTSETAPTEGAPPLPRGGRLCIRAFSARYLTPAWSSSGAPVCVVSARSSRAVTCPSRRMRSTMCG